VKEGTTTMTVYVVITLDGCAITDLEVLDAPPAWDLDNPTDAGPGGQVCYIASVNGGGSARWPSYLP
jgi:hypothetical protein